MRTTDTPYPDPITERTFEALYRAGITQTRVAECVSRSRQTITNWRQRGVPHSALDTLADLLNVPYESLRYGDSTSDKSGKPLQSTALDITLLALILDRIDEILFDNPGATLNNAQRAQMIAERYARAMGAAHRVATES